MDSLAEWQAEEERKARATHQSRVAEADLALAARLAAIPEDVRLLRDRATAQAEKEKARKDRIAEILKLHAAGMTFRQIADRMGISASRVSQIVGVQKLPLSDEALARKARRQEAKERRLRAHILSTNLNPCLSGRRPQELDVDGRET